MFDHFYMTGVGMAGYVIVYIPLVLFILFLSGYYLRKVFLFLCWSIIGSLYIGPTGTRPGFSPWICGEEATRISE